MSRLGEQYITREGYKVEIVKYFNSRDVSVKFEDGFILNYLLYSNIKTGQIKNYNHPSIYGKGYIGYGLYKPSSEGIKDPAYKIWSHILERCYSKQQHLNFPTYTDVTITSEWLNYQNFAKWFYEESNYAEGWEIDKDILSDENNKIYSPETCIFVPKEINSLVAFKKTSKNNLPVGITYRRGKYEARVQLNKKSKFLGNFENLETAYEVYKVEKIKIIRDIVLKYENILPQKVITTLKKLNV